MPARLSQSRHVHPRCPWLISPGPRKVPVGTLTGDEIFGVYNTSCSIHSLKRITDVGGRLQLIGLYLSHYNAKHSLNPVQTHYRTACQPAWVEGRKFVDGRLGIKVGPRVKVQRGTILLSTSLRSSFGRKIRGACWRSVQSLVYSYGCLGYCGI